MRGDWANRGQQEEEINLCPPMQMFREAAQEKLEEGQQAQITAKCNILILILKLFCIAYQKERENWGFSIGQS